MKNTKKYVKLYLEKSQESFEKWGYYYPPRNWKEFEEWDKKSFEKYCKNETEKTAKTKSYISFLANNFSDFGYLTIFNNDLNYKDLNNVIFQISRSDFLYKCDFDSEITGNHFHDVLCALACNDTDPANALLIKELSVSNTRFYTNVVVNLFKVILNNQIAQKDQVLTLAEKYLNSKRSVFDRTMVEYLMAVLREDTTKATESLQQLCISYQKRGYPVDKHDKCFATEIHGLYRFAKIVNESFFKELEMPNHNCFFKEFEYWQEENNYPKGKLFYTYPDEMTYMNKILKTQLPQMTYIENSMITNGKHFMEELTKKLIQ